MNNNQNSELSQLQHRFVLCGGDPVEWETKWKQRFLTVDTKEREEMFLQLNLHKMNAGRFQSSREGKSAETIASEKLKSIRDTAEERLRQVARSHYPLSDELFETDWPAIRTRLISDLIAEKVASEIGDEYEAQQLWNDA